MIDLKKAVLPEAVEVDGRTYPVHTSFKYWLNFLEQIGNKKNPPTAFDFMYKCDKPESRLNGLMALIAFCNPTQELPRTDSSVSEKAMDYAIDADYIYAAFMERYGIDLVESDMHWYRFQALLKGLHDTKLNEIIGYRMWENSGGRRDAYTRQMEKLRAAWTLPDPNDDDDDLMAFEALLKPKK